MGVMEVSGMAVSGAPLVRKAPGAATSISSSKRVRSAIGQLAAGGSPRARLNRLEFAKATEERKSERRRAVLTRIG
jgi:hypothetical protein